MAANVNLAEERFAPVNGLRLHYRVAGGGEASPVIVLHGIMGHAREWDILVGVLASTARVIAVDQRGHGQSDWAGEYSPSVMADDLIALVGDLGLAPRSCRRTLDGRHGGDGGGRAPS